MKFRFLFLPLSCAMLALGGHSHASGESSTAGADDSGANGEEDPAIRSGPIREVVGDLRLDYHASSGLQLHAFGLPLLRGSSIISVVPGWTHVFYNSRTNLTRLNRYTVEDYNDGRRITLRHEMAEEYGSPFSATKTITLYPDNRCHIRLDFRFDDDDPALLEWRVGGFNPVLAAGSPFRVVDEDGVREGVVPFESPVPGLEESTVARGFDRLQIASRIGDIVIESAAADNMIFFDYRKNRFAEEADPYFWLGFLERPIPAHTELSYEFTLQFPQKPETVGETVEETTAKVPVKPLEGARQPGNPRDFIIPAPKEMVSTGETMPLNSDTTIFTGPEPGHGIETAVEFLLRDLKEFYGITPNVVREDLPAEMPVSAIVLGEVGRFSAPAELLGEAGVKLPEHPEGYALRVNREKALIGANTEQGVFYGVTTLLQLLAPGEEGIVLRGVEIVDYPSLDFRGVHALTGKDAGGEISHAVRELMARHKMNSLVWQCSFLIWDAAPEIAHPVFGMEKEDARQVVETAEEYFINLIPLIPTLSHVRWMFTNDQNLDLAEDPETPHAYNVSNPRTYEFIFSILEEAIDFFEPSGFHIGHDEVEMWGRFPFRSAGSGLSATDLIIKDTVKLNDWFRERDINVYMWGDEFLHRDEATDAAFAPSLEEAKLRRSLLPTDITITDWHYEPARPEEFISIPIWLDAGFRTIGASWFDPLNIRNLAHGVIQNDAHGLLQTTWAGHNFAINDNETEWRQYWAYLLAAHYAWSGDSRLPEELPFVPRDEFVEVWFRTPPVLETHNGFELKLESVFNRTLVDHDGSGWLGYGAENDLRALPRGKQLLGDTIFRVAEGPEEPAALLMAGKFNPAGTFPETVTLEIEPRTASQLHFLVTGTHRAEERQLVGTIKVAYSDGSVDTMPLRYGREIFAFDQDRLGEHARIAWEGASGAGTPMRLWNLTWNNPDPQKKIKSIRIQSKMTTSSPVILAITGVEPLR